MPFRALGLDANILKAVQEVGYTEPTPIQAAAIPQVLAGHDLIGIAQTGTGKTAAFVLPILAKLAALGGSGQRRVVRALVVAPTRELVVQIDENVRAYARHLPLRVATVFGGVGERPQIDALRSGVDLVVATPGRLLDLMGRRHADFSGLNFLVLDEADRMLDMGFLPAIRRILQILPQRRQTLCYSATMEQSVASLVNDYTREPVRIALGSTLKPAESVQLEAYEVRPSEKLDVLRQLLYAEKGQTLIFTRTKRGSQRLAKELERDGFSAAMIHGDRTQSQRNAALSGFQEGRYQVLVATDIASRGLHCDDVAHVINYDLPKMAEDFIHRVGRTGRAGLQGRASTLVTGVEVLELRNIERTLKLRIERKQVNAAASDRPKRFVENTLASRTLTALPGEVFV